MSSIGSPVDKINRPTMMRPIVAVETGDVNKLATFYSVSAN